MSLVSTLLTKVLPVIEPMVKPLARAIANKLTNMRDAPFRAHYFPTWEDTDELGFVIARGMDETCWRCDKRDPKRRLFTSPPCSGTRA